MTDKSFKNDIAINYMEQLEQYFPHQLGLKKLSDKPLKYKLYGSITIDDSLQVDNFLDSLPHNQKLFIDLSNLSGMGTMFSPIIKKYCGDRENVSRLNLSYSALIHLYKIGISNKYIISQRQEVKIKNKNGMETITTKPIDNLSQ